MEALELVNYFRFKINPREEEKYFALIRFLLHTNLPQLLLMERNTNAYLLTAKAVGLFFSVKHLIDFLVK